ncbi:hypothetical protein ACTI_28730 [Actinoplanes sp. OR16]|uniref:CHAT domain-containing protein n=1 Tax=Actinoplanes sp. OR16 TaxID=946334 RepID=UPI000F6DD8EF|nr:CHAT domain-containing protein [Actinoplanes sp. OR16]BBH66188.1 hypothetical protein ACTI_28730 [Actinoplanes sp. OR16]
MTAGGDPAVLALVRLIAANGGQMTFGEVCSRLPATAAQLRRLVAEAGKRLANAHPMAMQPPLRLTPEGRAWLAEQDQRNPAEILVIRLTSRPDVEVENVCSTLFRGSTQLAAGCTSFTSYRLAAIRYLLSFAPEDITAGTTLRAAREIGLALLPPCRRCALPHASPCASCVRGRYREVLSEVSVDHRWIDVRLQIASPWHHVPWEMAALDTDDFVARDPAVSLVRTVGEGSHPVRVIDGPNRVLIAMPTMPAEDEQAFEAEATQIIQALSESEGPERRFDVVRLSHFDDSDALRSAVLREKPQVVHLIGHGSASGVAAAKLLMSKNALTDALAGVPIVVLGSCFGASEAGADAHGSSLARRIAEAGATSVVAFEGSAETTHATRFSVAFYRELARSGSVDRAVQHGRTAMSSGAPLYQWGQVVHFAGVSR